MRKGWIGLIIMLLCCTEAPAANDAPSEPAPSHFLSLETLAQTYTTPKELARFLRQAITFMTDEELFGEPDYWQTPEEFLARRAGDCEDYALFVRAVLERQAVEAHVLSLFGADGYSHTVCVFKDADGYHVINQDRLYVYRAHCLEDVAWQIYPAWTYGALSRQAGRHGTAIQFIHNPHPVPTTLSASDPLFSFP